MSLGARHRGRFRLGLALVCALVASGSPTARGAGVVEISHARALAGAVTPGDTPGYPVKITQPGSYVLTGDLAPTGTSDAIRILPGVSGVTLDLGGFTIRGPVDCTRFLANTQCLGSAGRGIFAEGKDVTVRNGSVDGMQDGLALEGATNARVDRIHATSNALEGIRTGSVSIVENSLADLNGRTGIVVGQHSIVSSSAARQNEVSGIEASFGCALVGNTVSQNRFGIGAGAGSALIGNVARDNNQWGFNLGPWTAYAENVLTENNSNVPGGDTNPELFGGPPSPIELGSNLCGYNTQCP